MASQEPISAEQLQVARTAAWRQAGDALLTLEAAQEWLAPLGLVLFAPRTQHLGAPAPSLVEATLGTNAEAPTLAQTETAHSLLARLVGEGHAVPLNLLGGPGDVPDFIATAQVFSFVFTLRGDKLWKQPPATSGTNKVTPLALSVYEMLAERGVMSAAELASELGRELTESAIARSLSELWQHLRVLPLPQQGDGATLWELTSRRFTKAIKAGANAGQPTALSALVSLYLAQALLASEEEVAGFLSPVAPRSRIREVLHALVAARELNELVIDGKTLLSIPGALPAFPEIEPLAAAEATGTGAEESAQPGDPAEGKIKRFAPQGESDSSAYRGKSSAGPGYRSKTAGGSFRKAASAGDGERRPPRAPRPAGAPSDRERRPFRRDQSASTRPERSQYAKPWDEERKPRPEAAPSEGTAATEPGSDAGPPRSAERGGDRPYRAKSFGAGGERPARKPYDDRKPYGDRSGDRPARGSNGEDRPRRSFSASASDRPARAPYGDRPARKPYGDRPARPPYSDRSDRPRPAGASGPRPSRPRSAAFEGGERPFRPRAASGDRPFRPRSEGAGGDRPFRARPATGSGDRPYRPRTPSNGEERPRRDSGERPSRSAGFSRGPGSGAGRPPREDGYNPVRREGSEGRPSFGRESGEGRPPRPGSRPAYGDKKPYSPLGASGEGTDRPPRSFGGGDREGSSRPRRTDGDTFPSGERPRPSGDRKAFGAKPFGAKSFGTKPSGAKPGGFARRSPDSSGGAGSSGRSDRGSFGAGRPSAGGKRPFSKGPAKGAGARPRKPKTDE